MSEKCQHCGQKIRPKHKHIFHKSLGDLLLKIAGDFGPGDPFNIRQDIRNKTDSQYTNCQHLKYWGLMQKHHDAKGRRVGRFWNLTESAVRFIRGEIKINAWVMVMDDRVVERSIDLVSLNDIVGTYSTPSQWAARATPRMAGAVQEDLFQ